MKPACAGIRNHEIGLAPTALSVVLAGLQAVRSSGVVAGCARSKCRQLVRGSAAVVLQLRELDLDGKATRTCLSRSVRWAGRAGVAAPLRPSRTGRPAPRALAPIPLL